MNLTKENKPLNKVIDTFFNNSLSDLFRTDFVQHKPSVNIVETDQDFQLHVAIPGFEKEEIKLDIDKDQLIISASKETDESLTFTKREFNYNSFKRSFHLSEKINREKIDANYEEGILTIRLEKVASSKIASKSIQIK